MPFRGLTAPRNLSALGVGDTVVRLKWDPPAEGATFKVKGYNLYRATAPAVVDLSQPPINKALIGADVFRWEDDGDQSLEAPKLGSVYNYAVVAVDQQDAPSPRQRGELGRAGAFGDQPEPRRDPGLQRQQPADPGPQDHLGVQHLAGAEQQQPADRQRRRASTWTSSCRSS